MDKNKANFRRPIFQALTLIVIALQFISPVLIASSQNLLEPIGFEHHSEHEHHESDILLHSDPDTSDCSGESCHCECPCTSYSALVISVDMLHASITSNKPNYWNESYRFQRLKAELRPPRFS